MIHQTAYYQVNKSSVYKVKEAVKEFTQYVKENEPGTILYLAWQKKDDPTSFVHFFIFENKAAQDTHSRSAAVKKFESIYSSELVSEGVSFTDYDLVATNQPQNS